MFSFTYVSITTYRHCTLSPPLSFPRPLLLSSSPKSMKAHAKINVDEIFNNRKLGSGQVGVRLGTARKEDAIRRENELAHGQSRGHGTAPRAKPSSNCHCGHAVVCAHHVLLCRCPNHGCSGEQYCRTTSMYWRAILQYNIDVLDRENNNFFDPMIIFIISQSSSFTYNQYDIMNIDVLSRKINSKLISMYWKATSCAFCIMNNQQPENIDVLRSIIARASMCWVATSTAKKHRCIGHQQQENIDVLGSNIAHTGQTI